MKRNLKALGLALIALVAMSAVVASAAQADNFTAEKYTVTVKGSQPAAEKHVFTVEGGRKVECETAEFAGSLTALSSDITITPTYAGCHAVILGAETDATVTFSPCVYTFTTAKNAGGTSRVVHLVCSTGNVTIHVYDAKGGEHTTAHEICSYSIAAQTIENGVTYTNNAGPPKTITVGVNSTGIAYTRTVGTATKCGAASSTATYKGNVTVSGKNSEGGNDGIDVG